MLGVEVWFNITMQDGPELYTKYQDITLLPNMNMWSNHDRKTMIEKCSRRSGSKSEPSHPLTYGLISDHSSDLLLTSKQYKNH